MLDKQWLLFIMINNTVGKSRCYFGSASVVQQETFLECASVAFLDKCSALRLVGFRAGLFSSLSQ